MRCSLIFPCIAAALSCGGSSGLVKMAQASPPVAGAPPNAVAPGGTAPITIDWGFRAGTATVVTTVHPGARVQWRSTDGTHTVLPDAGPPPSNAGPAGQGTVFGAQTVTAAPGTYGYHCSIHTSMRGKLIVQ